MHSTKTKVMRTEVVIKAIKMRWAIFRSVPQSLGGAKGMADFSSEVAFTTGV